LREKVDNGQLSPFCGVFGKALPFSGRGLYKVGGVGYSSDANDHSKEHPNMAHKKIERHKELQRKRHRREQRLKQRIREARAAKA
jgi:hypothetical protein